MHGDSLVGLLLPALDIVVFERLPNSTFLERTPPPPWFADVFAQASGGEAITLAQALPFLDSFLTDAEAFWRENRAGIIRSDLFTAQHEGEEYLLWAAALTMAEQRLLVLQRLTGAADPSGILQKAREAALGAEQLAQRLAAVQAATQGLGRAVQQLAEQSAGDGPREIIERVRQASERLTALAAGAPGHGPRR